MSGKLKKLNSTANKHQVFLSKALIFVGKPLFTIFFILLFLLFQLIFLPAYIFDVVKKSGNSFKSKFKKKPARRNDRSYFSKNFSILFWNLSIFILALRKLPEKLRTDKKRIVKQEAKWFKFPTFSVVKVLGIVLLTIFLAGLTGGALFWNYIIKDLPLPSELTDRDLTVSTKIYDRRKELLYTIFKDQKRTPVKLVEIPIEVRLATVAAEDKDFYTHPGFSVRGIVRAIIKDIRERKLTGGSTITQQLVKNALLTPEKTLVRKLKEITLSIQVERYYSKDQILEMYLNEVPYGGTAYGIEEASNTFFDKKVGELTLAESALLAGLPQSPSKYSPFGSGLENAMRRQKEILGKMEQLGFITTEQRRKAENENVNFSKSKVIIKAPHFVFYIRDLLEQQYGKEIVEKGGLEVVTSLDYEIQKVVEKVVTDELVKLESLNVGNASVVVMDPKSGEILAMVGSKNFFDIENDGNVNVAIRPRQPGSSIKVINYAFALSNGLTPATIVPDTPETFKTDDGQLPYTPKNYEGEFRGNITLRSALAESRNIPAVRVLASYGVQNMIDLGRKMGITTWTDPKNYGLSLTLGGGEVKLLDLARVFATLANYGKRPELKSVLEVKNYQENVLAEFKCENAENANGDSLFSEVSATGSSNLTSSQASDCDGEQVLDPRVAYMITDILKDNSARAPAFGENSLLNIKNHPEVAVKTGTSNDLRDNLAVGYTKDYVVAVWIGNNDNSEMSRIASGVTGATPIFNKIMSALLANKPASEWEIPERLVHLPICPQTGTLACKGCPVKMEWFLEENKPAKSCDSLFFVERREEKDEDKDKNESTPKPKRMRRQDFERILNDQMRKLRDQFNIDN